MKRTSTLIAWAAVVLVSALAVLNWTALTATAPLNLVVAEIQAPLGVLLLAVSAMLTALFLVAHLRTQIGAMLEARKLLKEIQRVQELADKSEASRVESLRQLIVAEFRQLDERLSLSERLWVSERMKISERLTADVAEVYPSMAGRPADAARSW